MWIVKNILVILMAAAGAFWLIGPLTNDAAYTLLAPVNAEVLFPFDRHTIFQLLIGNLVTGLHILFLSSAIFWVSRWISWKCYAYRLGIFLCALMTSVGAFWGLGFVYRHFSVAQKSRVFGSELPVVEFLSTVFVGTVIITLYTIHRMRRTK